MTSIIKVDAIQMSNGDTPSISDMGFSALTATDMPAGSVLQILFDSENTGDYTVNNTTLYGTVSVSLTRKQANSKFIITINTSTYRPSTTGQVFIGYERGTSNITTIERYVTDSMSTQSATAIFEDTTTGSVGDVLVFRSTYRNTASQNDLMRYPAITVMEVAQ
jgi:hypothetical protein